MTEHVRQIDRCGCAVACMAMIRGVPYEVVRADVGEVGRGHDFMAWQDYLARHGFAAQMAWHTDQIAGKRRDPWPLAPWADVHLCCVDGGLGAASHLVVMLADGTVLDPAADTARNLKDYPSVAYMAGVFRVGTQPLRSPPSGALAGEAEGRDRQGSVHEHAAPQGATP